MKSNSASRRKQTNRRPIRGRPQRGGGPVHEGHAQRRWPVRGAGRDTTLLREILDGTARRVTTDLTNQPAVEADLFETLGMVYSDIGNFTNAYAMLQKALDIQLQLHGEKDLRVASVLNQTRIGLASRREAFGISGGMPAGLGDSRGAFGPHQSGRGRFARRHLERTSRGEPVAGRGRAKARDCLALRRELSRPSIP